MKYLLLLLISIYSFAETSKFEQQLNRDRKDIFYDICTEQIPGANYHCDIYKKRVSGNNLKEIHNSINQQLYNVAKRNAQYGVDPYDAKVHFRRFRLKFEEYLKDSEPSQEYLDYLFGKPIAPAPVVITNPGGTTLTVSDFDDGKKETPPEKKEDVNQGGQSGTVAIKPPEKSEDIDLSKTFEAMTSDVVETFCKYSLMKKSRLDNSSGKYCQDLGKQLKGKSLSEIFNRLNNDKKLDIDVNEKLLKDTFKAFAKKKLVLVEADQLDRFYKHIDEMKITPESPVTQEVSSGVTGVAGSFQLTEEEKASCKGDAICEATLLEKKKQQLAQQGVAAVETTEKKDPPEEDKAQQGVAAVGTAEKKDPPEEDKATALNAADCENKIKLKILELLQDGEHGRVLSKQFQLTSLKLALAVAGKDGKYNNVEDYIRSEQQALINTDNQDTLNKLKQTYIKYGTGQDLKFIENSFQRMKKSVYWDKKERLYNEHLSAFMLADSMTNENSKFNELDAAIAWFGTQVTKQFPAVGSRQRNLTNLSTLAYRQLELLRKGGDKKANIKRIESQAKKLQDEVKGEFSLIGEEVKKSLKACFEYLENSCKVKDPYNNQLSKAVFDLTHQIFSSDEFSIQMKDNFQGSILKGKDNKKEVIKLDFLPIR